VSLGGDTATQAALTSLQIDETRLHQDRINRARSTMRRHGLAAILVFDPMNVRYLSVPGMGAVWSMHTSSRWVLLPAESRPVLWEYEHSIPNVPAFWAGETRPARTFTFFGSGWDADDDASRFAREIAEVLRERGLLEEPLGVDRLETNGLLALLAEGIQVVDAQPVMEDARAIKSVDEIAILRANARVCDQAIEEMVAAMEPGMTEHQIWSIFIGSAFRRGAEWCETRLLASGRRTNPWMQEATHRVVEGGELVALDTDLVGEFGYLTDISRTYISGDRRGTDEQRRLHTVAYEFVHGSIPEIRPGASFRELGEALGARLPEEFQALRYPFVAHGSGMVDEYPCIKFDNHHDGEVEVGMVLSVEAYVGAVGGREGVKLEEQIVIGEAENELLSRAPYDVRLMP
jgi:Xaa-Pro dipeptidase